MEWWRYIYRGGVHRAMTEEEKEHLVKIWLFSQWWKSPECYKKTGAEQNQLYSKEIKPCLKKKTFQSIQN